MEIAISHYGCGGYAWGMGYTVSSELKKMLRARGLRVKDVINLTGWSRPTVSRHINGARVPNYEQRVAYAKILGASMEEVNALWPELDSAKSPLEQVMEWIKAGELNHEDLARLVAIAPAEPVKSHTETDANGAAVTVIEGQTKRVTRQKPDRQSASVQG